MSHGLQPNQRRIYGAGNIDRYMRQYALKGKRYDGSGSLAGLGNGEREIARRLRQAERNAARQRERALAACANNVQRAGLLPHIGLSRRGRRVVLPL